MRKILAFVIVALCVTKLSAQGTLPSSSLEDVHGKTVRLADVAESRKPIIFVFWGAICPTCNNALNTLSDEFDTWRDEVDFQLIAVCTEDVRGSSKARSKAIVNDWPFTLLFDKNQDLKRGMNVNAVPYFIIYNENGEVVFSRAGYIPGLEQEVYEALKKN